MIFAHVVTRLLPLLNADTAADLVWWTEAELYEWMGEAAQRLAQNGMFVERKENLTVLSGSAGVGLPAVRLAVIHVSLDGLTLRTATVQDLEALSSTWVTDAGNVERYSLEVSGLDTVRLYRIPETDGMLAVIYQSWPLVSSAISTHRAPTVVGDYYTYAVLCEARAKHGEAQALDIAAVARERAKLLSSVFAQYWGSQ